MKNSRLALIGFLFSFFVHVSGAYATSSYTTYSEFLTSLDKLAQDTLENSEVVRQEFLDLQKTHGIAGSDDVFREFVRVRLAFEATRDSGLWQLRWSVTDREPNSDAIWLQWDDVLLPELRFEEQRSTATAECDELSALFAFIAIGLGVKEVGLFWPTWNHTVAVWTTEDTNGKPVRVVVPTTQVFLSGNATLGTKEFDPYKQKVIYRYHRKDVSIDYKISSKLAEQFLKQVEDYGAKPSALLQERRNILSRKIGGS